MNMSNDAEAIATAESGDGLRRWQLLRRPTGFYVYEESTLEEEIYSVDDDGNEGDVVAEAYWMPTHVSGLFATADEAKADAVATLGWLTNDLMRS
jgi:hypothetical protein